MEQIGSGGGVSMEPTLERSPYSCLPCLWSMKFMKLGKLSVSFQLFAHFSLPDTGKDSYLSQIDRRKTIG